MKTNERSVRRLAAALCFFLLAAAPAARADDGIFADFTTSMGNFSCQLDYTNAPKAVANFIGLATGQRAWLDVASGQVRTNTFYDGLTFHRVIAGFMIQGGSPNGQGTDGPGYVFPDEFTPLVRFSAPGVLAMANSGTNSNGAQCFITVTNTPWLNDVHTIFGKVVSGMPVVYAISQVPTDANNKPLTSVVVLSVVIRRVGTAAQAFSINAQGLPIVSAAPLAITRAGTNITLNFTNSLNAEVFLRSASNLMAWTSSSLGVDLTAPALTNAQRSAGAPAQFYALSRVQYPSSTFAPRNLNNRTLTLNINGLGTLVNSFNSAGGGSFTYGGSSGTILSYDWTQAIYSGYLWPIYYDWFDPLTLQLFFSSNGGGAFSGKLYDVLGTYNISGTFTISGP